MRYLLKAAFVLFVAIPFLPRGGAAQWDYLDVAPGFETLNLAIEGDTTATGEPVSLNRVYRLQRGGMYVMNGRVNSLQGSPLRIWAADGDGPKPLIIRAQPASTEDFARIYGDAHFKNLYLSGIDNIGVQCRYTMAVYDTGARVVWEGIHIDHSRQSHIRTYGTETKLFFIDCEFRNSIDLANPSNGRFFDSRGLVADTVMFQNCTIYLNSHRMLRTSDAMVRNFILDHNTFYQNLYGGYSSTAVRLKGPIETWTGLDVRVTNNIFQDLCLEALRHQKTLDPPDRFSVISVDSLDAPTGMEGERDWLVRNNAYGWSPVFKTFWEGWSNDTLYAKGPTFISPYGDSMFFRTNPKFVQTGNFEELIQFADAPATDSVMAYVSTRFATGFVNGVALPDPRADRNGIGDLTTHMETFGLESDPFNFDYPTTQAAYTAGDGGFPVGDLNWFPSKKAEWLLTDVKPEEGIATDYRLAQNFPNPFNPATQIDYSLPKSARVSLAIYNAIGQVLARLVNNEVQAPGAHTVTWNGKDASGKTVSSGVYFYRLETPDAKITKKMMLLK